jgi:hypothetical protein
VPGGTEAVRLRVAEQYVSRFGDLAKASNTVVVPANVADLASMITLAMSVLGRNASPGATGAEGAPGR